MVIVIGYAQVALGDVDALKRAAAPMIEATRKEAGCLDYAYGEDILTPGRIMIAERWESEEALAAHLKTAHVAAFTQALGQAQIEHALVEACGVSGSRVVMRR